MAQRGLYLAAYDIRDDRRRYQALQWLREFSTGGQKSVFECFLTEDERIALLTGMTRIVDFSTDSFVLIRLDPRAKVHTLGKGRPPADPDVFYIG
ncbi:MAG: CRISPR-associated endonuclease Cas2 [Candidatus Dadabacteria bacterium]|nr:MAG: CRISPR-associated endonuclease Cas2 [Candidatus Dadabacteria bacterium]